MKKRILYLLFTSIIDSIFLSPQALLSAPYYEGKTLKIVVGFTPGGGYDRMGRLLAKHLPKHIPGKPSIIVENMEGAGSIICSNYIYNVVKPDGLTIGTVNRGISFAQLTKVEGVKFDVMKYSWIGSAAVEASVLTVRNDLPYKTYDDLRKVKEPIPLGTMGPASSDHQFLVLLREFAGLNTKLIFYPSSAEAMLAIERKEVDGRAGSYSSIKPFIERGLVHPVIRGRVSEKGIENLPVNEDLTTDPTGKTIMAMLDSADRMGRPYFLPPGTPANIMNILRDAFSKVANDSELKEEAKKNRMEVTYIPADDCLKAINYLFKQPESIVKEFSKYVKF